MTNTWDAANRLTQIVNPKSEIVNLYNGVNDRVGQVVDGVTTHFALDVQGLPEVIYTSEGNAYLHLPGVIMTENITGEVRYLLSDGLGSVRQAVDENAAVVAYNEFDPYGNPVNNGGEPYGFTGEWWENEVGLLHLRARWYSVETGTFLSRDSVEGEPAYAYVRGNVVNRTDPSGLCAQFGDDACWSVYEQIIRLCPECKDVQRATFTGDRYLHEENIYYLKDILGRMQNGWRPSPPVPGGISEIAEAIRKSHENDDDGMIFGFSHSVSYIWLFNTSAQSPREWINLDLKFNGACLPDTGDTKGREIVFDFKHQEVGLFKYSGDVLNVGTVVNGSLANYVGKTRGFVNAGYDRGVGAYKNYFFSGSLYGGVNDPLLGVFGAGVVDMEAAPLDDNKNLDPTGVFATYYGAAGGFSVGPSTVVKGLPVTANAEAAVTFYELERRYKYVPLEDKRRDTFWRGTAAIQMIDHMKWLSLLNPIGRALLPQSVIQVIGFVNKG
jgi:RHS repeat-associated protein